MLSHLFRTNVKQFARRPHLATPTAARCVLGANELPESIGGGEAIVSRLSSADGASTSATRTLYKPGANLTARSHSAQNVHIWRAEPKRRLRVAVDVDEVLAQFLVALNKFCLDEYGMKYQVEDYSEYVFAKIWKCDQTESNRIVHEFFKSRHFSEEIPPIPGAYDALQNIRQFADLVVVTSRQHVIQEPTLRWIETHFPGTFTDVHFGNHWALEGKSKAKSEICKDVGAQVLIDDNPIYARDCASAGIPVLLYDWQLGYPWSKTADGPHHPLITRVQSWQEVERQLASMAQEMAGGAAAGTGSATVNLKAGSYLP